MMNVRRFLRLASLPLGAVSATLILGGCTVASSLQFDSRLMLKVPGERKIIAAEAGGWKFRHIVEGPKDKDPPGQWYVAWRPEDERTGVAAPSARWAHARAEAPAVADAARRALGAYPLMIEPNLVFMRMAARADMKSGQPSAPGVHEAGGPRQLEYGAAPSGAWPAPKNPAGQLRPAWHLDDDYSQLASARAQVEKSGSRGPPIRIGILDNGFSARQQGEPSDENLEDDKLGDALDIPYCADDGCYLQPPGASGASHGTGTLGILAGREVDIPQKSIGGRTVAAFRGRLGGAPGDAVVVPVRVAPWVFSVTTANLAYGIDYASRVKHCDILTLSHGGAPSQVWADAVNAAYDRGTAMFAAEGDFFSLLAEPIQPKGIIVPSAPVYPAAFRRVMGVTGVAADGTSYAENSLWALVRNPLAFAQWFSRGSYGPDGSWRTPLMHSEKADPILTGRLGELRAHPVAGYSPNIPWLRAPSDKDPRANLVDLNGAGTSASTPQVAAAAALWLKANRARIGAARWSTWEKAEAVYTALLLSAQRSADRPWPDRYLGAGSLKAKDALARSFDEVRQLREHPLTEDGKVKLRYDKSPRDFFDGTRSVSSLFGLAENYAVRDRADLDQHSRPLDSRELALTRLYYNIALLQAWHAGRLVHLGAEADRLWRQSADLARAATPTAAAVDAPPSSSLVRIASIAEPSTGSDSYS